MADYGGYHVMTLAGTAITATTAATANTVGTTIPLKPAKALIITNTCDQPISLAFNLLEVLRIGKTASMIIPYGELFATVQPNTVIGAFNLGTPPTTGYLSITAIT